jgi:acetylornithine deacetylase/succinyl-diaminopimelate desuccinylase-like protein
MARRTSVETAGKPALARKKSPERELAELIELLQALIRIPTVNPPGGEIKAARYLEQVLVDAGLKPQVVEPYPDRGSIVCRVRGDGSGGDPLLLLSHLDVVPAPPEGWTHDPFGGEMEGGYIWGRGALDMKSMVAMEVQVMRLLAATARAAGRDPAADPIPGLRRDIIFCSTADEEAGGWVHAAGALNEAGGIAISYAGTRFYPIQVAEKGFVVYKLTVHGRWGHGSVPTEDNAAVLAAQIVAKLAAPGPARLTETVWALLGRAMPRLGPAAQAAIMGLASSSPVRVEATLRELCDPVLARQASAVIHDTISTGVLSSGIKYNVIPGKAEIELDCRTLPGTDESAMRNQLRERMGEELWSHVEVECRQVGPAVQAPMEGPLYGILEAVLRHHDPDGVPVPMLAPYATDAKHLARIGVPTYGFSPLKLNPEDSLLQLMHGDDERVSVEALRFGLPVLWEAVIRFCG